MEHTQEATGHLKQMFLNLFDSFKQQPLVRKIVNATQSLKPKLIEKLVSYLNHSASSSTPLIKIKKREIVSNLTLTSNSSIVEEPSFVDDFSLSNNSTNSSDPINDRPTASSENNASSKHKFN